MYPTLPEFYYCPPPHSKEPLIGALTAAAASFLKAVERPGVTLDDFVGLGIADPARVRPGANAPQQP